LYPTISPQSLQTMSTFPALVFMKASAIKNRLVGGAVLQTAESRIQKPGARIVKPALIATQRDVGLYKSKCGALVQ